MARHDIDAPAGAPAPRSIYAAISDFQYRLGQARAMVGLVNHAVGEEFTFPEGWKIGNAVMPSTVADQLIGVLSFADGTLLALYEELPAIAEAAKAADRAGGL